MNLSSSIVKYPSNGGPENRLRRPPKQLQADFELRCEYGGTKYGDSHIGHGTRGGIAFLRKAN
jgi:hypothetical protein